MNYLCLISISIDSVDAYGFLTNSRPQRNIDPKWYRGTPDFQSYYRFYNRIGHAEGLYEIDRIRMLYQQMRHMELTFGPDASRYQNVMGLQTSTATPTTITQPTSPPTTVAPTPDPLENAEKLYLCNLKDTLCKPHIVYLPTGAVPVLCHPRINPACRPGTEEEIKAAAPLQMHPPPVPHAPKISNPPPPPANTVKGMEYDCDPYWDPDCLVDHPPRPIQKKHTPEKIPYAYYDPYDFKRDLYDPLLYTTPEEDVAD
uniref:Actinodin3 n=1 Tax=Mastacembelus armatus TaxID=205130 RepID=A0A3Q3L7I9_9TELE